MKRVFEKWWGNDSKYFGICNYKKAWKENGNKPRIDFYTNGAKKEKSERHLFGCAFDNRIHDIQLHEF